MYLGNSENENKKMPRQCASNSLLLLLVVAKGQNVAQYLTGSDLHVGRAGDECGHRLDD
jgi:hypothetical protein